MKALKQKQTLEQGGVFLFKAGGKTKLQNGGRTTKRTENVSQAELAMSDKIDKSSPLYKKIRDRYLKDTSKYAVGGRVNMYEDGDEIPDDTNPLNYEAIPTYGSTEKFNSGFKAMNNGKTVMHTVYNKDKTKAAKMRFTAGTWDGTNPNQTNSYNNIKSSNQFDATRANAQSKLDYSGFGGRTKSGLAGNRGKEGINKTDELATQREKAYRIMETNPSYFLPGGDGYSRVDQKTGGLKSEDGKYILGRFESINKEKPKTPPNPIPGNQTNYLVMTNKGTNNSTLPVYGASVNQSLDSPLNYANKQESTSDFIKALENSGTSVKREYVGKNNYRDDYYQKGVKVGTAGDSVSYTKKDGAIKLDFSNKRPKR
jgi:hypothetical protein